MIYKLFVEMNGVEPSSKQGTNMLSTRLFSLGFSSANRTLKQKMQNFY
ncbi:MAG: hypothetical protein FWD66_08945 [Paludibacter sp.]|nr:hypothetical protein [Paludibacter sp.]